MSKLGDKIKAETKKKPFKPAPGDPNPYIRPKHRAIFERMKQGETITGAMIAMSYKPSVVDNPQLITKSKSWKALMDEQLPEDHVAMRHREILDSRKFRYVIKGKGKNRREERVDDGPDPIVMRGVELAYKLRGRTKEDAPPADRPNIYNIFYQKNVQESVKAFEDNLKHTIAHEIRTEDTGGAGELDQANDAGAYDLGRSADTDAGTAEGDGGQDGEARDILEHSTD